jgi:cytohesin
MKLLTTTIAAVLLVGCGPPKPPDISIHDAIIKGDIEAVKQHLAAGVDVNARGDSLGFEDIEWTPLRGAAYGGDKEIAELLIAKGANVNAKGNHGQTPLHEAAFEGHKEVAELFIDNGADVNAKIKLGEHKGQTPLDLATHPKNPKASTELADLLRKHGGKTAEELKAEGK